MLKIIVIYFDIFINIYCCCLETFDYLNMMRKHKTVCEMRFPLQKLKVFQKLSRFSVRNSNFGKIEKFYKLLILNNFTKKRYGWKLLKLGLICELYIN